MTGFLVFVVLQTALNEESITTSKDGAISTAPIAIGMAVFLAHNVLIPIDGVRTYPVQLRLAPNYG